MTALKTAFAILCLVALVPLFVLGATGSWRHAWFALREYAVAMAWVCIPALIVVIVTA